MSDAIAKQLEFIIREIEFKFCFTMANLLLKINYD